MGKLLGLMRAPERRVHPSSHTNWALYGLGGGHTTATGKEIDENIALTSTIVYACITCLSQTVSSLPLVLYARVDENTRKRASDHPLYKILHDAPNPEMISMVFRETMMMHLTGWGNFYAHIIYNKAGAVAELWPLRPDKMTVERKNGQLIYRYILPSGEERILPRDEVLHIPALGFDGIQGYSPIAQCKESIGLTMAGEEFGARFFANNATPGLALTHPGTLSGPAQDRLRTSWEKLHVGLENKHRLAILEEGMKIEKIGIPPNEAQWIELRKFQLDEIARIYRIPPPLIGNLERATFSNVEELNKYFATHTIRPWCSRVEQVMANRLLTLREQETYYIEHLMDGLLRSDIGARYSAYSTGRQWGWLSANDVRRMENMNPVDEGGDVYLVPVNMAPSSYYEGDNFQPQQNQGGMGGQANLEKKEVRGASLEVSGQKAADRIDKAKKSHFPIILDVAQRIVNREAIALERMVKKHVGQRDAESFNRALNEFYGLGTADYIKKVTMPVYSVFTRQVYEDIYDELFFNPDVNIRDLNLDDKLDKFLAGYIDRYSERHIFSSVESIKRILKESPPEELEARLLAKLAEWTDKKPFRIATDEVTRASNAVARETYKHSGVTKLVWRARGKSCPFCNALNGKTVGIDDHFVKSGMVMYVRDSDKDVSWYDPITGQYSKSWGGTQEGVSALKFKSNKLHPPIHRGCDCYIVPVQGR